MIDADLLDHLEQLERKATAGRWRERYSRDFGMCVFTPGRKKPVFSTNIGLASPPEDEDLQLILALRNAWPTLLRLARKGLEP